MQSISVEELLEHKILPFNIYDDNENKLFDAGEVLTPGKILQLKQLDSLYIDFESEIEVTPEAEEAAAKEIEAAQKLEEEKNSKNEEKRDKIQVDSENDIMEESNNEKVSIETAEKIHTERKTLYAETDEQNKLNTEHIIVDDFEVAANNEEITYSMDDMDISNFRGTLNRNAKISPELQLKFKAFHIYILNSLNTKKTSDISQMYSHLKDRIISDIVLKSDDMRYFSELKLLGEYKKCHPLNVAILSGILAYRMNLKEGMLSDIVLGALVHDIGKIKIPNSILEQPTLTDKEQKIFHAHTKIGYKILKENFKLPESIAKIALEHHESNNGSGYPYGKSGDFISRESQVVNVCNHFDNLISNTTTIKIHNCHEACKLMIELGSKKFAADALYTFINMFSYNDVESLEEMAI